MILEKDLKQMGIEEVEKLDDNTIIEISGQVTTMLTAAFDKLNLSFLEIYRRLLSTPMYYANIPQKISPANYFYKNSSIYFSQEMKFDEINEYAFHECVHRIQEHKNKKGEVSRLGICSINEVSVTGTALNEAAIQYITAKSLNIPKKTVTIYGITLPIQTEYYPIITNLISQISYLMGEEKLVNGTLNSNEDFKYEFMDLLGEGSFSKIQANFDDILHAKNNILELEDTEGNDEKINENIENIKNLYIETQNLIFTSYFDSVFKRIKTIDGLTHFRENLYSYRSLIGTVKGYDYFSAYCLEQDKKSRKKAEEIRAQNAYALVKENKVLRVFRKLKQLFINSDEYNK